MALLDGKQLRVQSTSLDKLSGHSGLVTFTASATMSFGAGSTLRQANENILTSLDVVNKNYVDSVAQGLSVKPSVHVISNTSSVILSGTQSIDGVVVNVGERVLVNYQNSGSPDSGNGIYVVATGSWTRAEDSDGINIGSEVQLGNFVFVAFGQSFAGTGWVLSQTDSLDYDILVGTESQLWTQFSSTGTITAGEGLVQNGPDFDVLTGTGLTVSVLDNKLNIADTGVTASNYGSTNSVGAFSVNSQGQLTSAQLILIDIDSSQINNFTASTETVIFTDANFVDGATIQFDVTTGASTSAQVVLGSLTASRLDIINSASASQDYILGFNAGGQFEWFEPSLGDITEVIAGNGLQGGGPSGSVTLDVNVTNGITIISDNVQIDPTAAGIGLTFSSGIFDLNLAGSSGLTVSVTNFLSIDSGIGGDGLTFSGGVLGVNTAGGITTILDFVQIDPTLAGQGLTFSSGVLDVIWGGTASGLSFSNGYAQIEVDNSTIQINTSGQLVAVGGSSQPVYLTTTAVATTGNDSEVTGTTIGATPSDFSRIQVFVNGQLQRLGNGNPLSDCYFGTTGSSTLLANLQSGEQLYWNGTNAGFELSATDKIDIIYES